MDREQRGVFGQPDQRVDTFGGGSPRVFTRPLNIPAEQPPIPEAAPAAASLPATQQYYEPAPVIAPLIIEQPPLDEAPLPIIPLPELQQSVIDEPKRPSRIKNLFKPRAAASKLKSVNVRSALGFGVATLLLAGGGILTYNNFAAKPAEQTAQKASEKPTFPALIPDDSSNVKAKDADAIVNYDPSKGVVSFSDKFSGSLLTVSQQPIPATVVRDSKNIEQVIGSVIGLRRTIDTAQGKAYVITNDEIKEQTVIVHAQNQLMFIRTTDMLKPEQWKQYIDSFKTTK